MKKLSVKKGQILQTKGELNSKVYFVKSGLLRSYAVDAKGKEYIFMFAPKDWTIADSSPPNQLTTLFIDVLEDAEIVVLEKGKDDTPNVQKLLNRMNVLQKRIILLMSSTAIERYEDFIQTYPDIAQRVPQRMIASYLGITPEALSKVKGERRQKS